MTLRYAIMLTGDRIVYLQTPRRALQRIRYIYCFVVAYDVLYIFIYFRLLLFAAIN